MFHADSKNETRLDLKGKEEMLEWDILGHTNGR